MSHCAGESVIWVDYEGEKSRKFEDELTVYTGKKWNTEKCVCNKERKGLKQNLHRYWLYGSFAFSKFCHRKRYETIIAWQEFFGIFYAFFCRLFHVKKVNRLGGV